jgi:mono/diheme cytochrome c family protein
LKKTVVLAISFLTFSFLGVVSALPRTQAALTASHSVSGAQEGPLPASLDAFFPPKAPHPVYLSKMMALGTVMSGIMADLFENDVKNAVGNFASLKATYVDVSQLVPEWRKFFPLAPMDEFGNALKALGQSKDMGRVMAAGEKLGQVCTGCHSQNMVKAQQKYHWKSFHEIMAKDPLSGQQINFARLMQSLEVGFAGSWVDLGQGQRENAQKQFQGFNAVFQAMKATCAQCHGTNERKYYVDAEAQTLVNEYGKTLGAQSADMKKAESAMMRIGEEICFKCHLVHVPAAFSKLR